MDREQIAYEQLLQGIQAYVDKYLSEVKCDITITGIVTAINADNTYNVLLNNKEYKNIPTLGGKCTVNETVRVLVPQAEYSNMFILKSGGSSEDTPTVAGVQSVNGKTGTVTLTASDVGALSSSTQLLGLGVTATTAFRGDYGNTAYTHAQKTSGNPHNVSKSDVGLSNVENKSSADIRGEITSANVTTALGFTPTANVGTITGIKMNGASKGTSGVVDLGTVITAHQDISGKADKATTLAGYGITDAISSSLKGVANGIATLDKDGKVPSSQLPSYVDDVLEYATKSAFPTTGESGKIYVDLATNKTYRWSGSAYVEISPSIVIGTTTGTALDGKVGTDHINNTSNPHGVTKAQVGLGNVENKSSATIRGEITSANVTTALGFTPTANVGTITGIKMNGASKGTSGVVDLGTVITAHQDISGKQDKLTAGANIKIENNVISATISGDVLQVIDLATWKTLTEAQRNSGTYVVKSSDVGNQIVIPVGQIMEQAEYDAMGSGRPPVIYYTYN